MKRRPAPIGTCHLCGKVRRLTFEHVPPASVFNHLSVVAVDALVAVDDPLNRKGPTQQRGIGHYRLCAKCNNHTGAWYTPALAELAHQAYRYMCPTRTLPSLAIPYYVSPLRVLKQIVTMFLVINAPGFPGSAELARFVLDKSAKGMPKPFRVFTYATASNSSREVGWARKSTRDGRHWTFAELSLRPLGYVMTDGCEAPRDDMCEVTDFGKAAYDDLVCVFLQLPVLSTDSALPGDYRTAEQVAGTRRRKQAVAGTDIVYVSVDDDC